MTRHNPKDRPPLVVVGPLPPPVHGVAISTALILESPRVNDAFDVRHLDTSDSREAATIGRWDTRNVRLGLTHGVQLAFMIARRRRGVVYFPLSQNSGGFLRDSLLIWVATIARWRVATHLRGSEFRSHFYASQGPLLRWWI